MSNKNLDNLFKNYSKPWDSAWGYVGGTLVSKQKMVDNGGNHGRFSFPAKKGRRYKVVVNIPIGTGVSVAGTRTHAHVNYDSSWLSGGEYGAYWYSGTANIPMSHISIQPIISCIADKITEVYINISADVSGINPPDSQIFNGQLYVEDIGPV